MEWTGLELSGVGGGVEPPSSCLQTLIFEWKSALNFNPWAKFQTFRQVTSPPVLLGQFQHWEWNGVWRDLWKITMAHIIDCFADCRIRQLVSRWLSYYWSYSATFWWAQQCSPSGRAGRWWMQPTSASSPSPPSVLVTLCREPPRAESAKRILWFWSSPAYTLYLDSRSSPWLSVLYRSVRPSLWGALSVAPRPSVRPSRASDFLEGKPYEKLLI